MGTLNYDKVLVHNYHISNLVIINNYSLKSRWIVAVCLSFAVFLFCRECLSCTVRVCPFPREFVLCRESLSCAVSVCLIPWEFVFWRERLSFAVSVCLLPWGYVLCRESWLLPWVWLLPWQLRTTVNTCIYHAWERSHGGRQVLRRWIISFSESHSIN